MMSPVPHAVPVPAASVSERVPDPHAVSIWQDATNRLHDQPAVTPDRLTSDALRRRFLQPLDWRQEERHDLQLVPSGQRDAAVLIGLQRGQEAASTSDWSAGLEVLLTQRTAQLRAHAGQIAFPGGKIDAQDRDAVDAALREAREEVGLERQGIQVLGALRPYVTHTGYRILPVVALLPRVWTRHPNPAEVADIFTVPLGFLMDPRNHRKHVWHAPTGERREWFSMPYDDPEQGVERYIWGVTAGILRDLYHFLQAG